MSRILEVDELRGLVGRIFAAAGCETDEARRIAGYLVEANLVGHDSHGVIRVPTYIDWLLADKVVANQSLEIVTENDSLAVVDGRFGFGQTIGEQAVRLGIDKAQKSGVAAIALSNSGHLGRIGDWPLLAARAGLVSLHFVNTSGMGMLVAPFGGITRRMSACPIAAGVPLADDEPIILDVSMATIAEGKIRVAFNKGVPVPDGCIIDSAGQPTNDPRVFYADPPGAILPIAGHKGSGLAFITEVFAGAMTGGSCTSPEHASRLANGMFSIYFKPEFFAPDQAFQTEMRRFIEFVKSAEKTTPGGEILVPGEIELRTRAARSARGIELDDNTWAQIEATCRKLGFGAA